MIWKTELDQVNRDLAHGRAAIRELEHLKTLIEYWITAAPETGEIIVKISRDAQIASKDFRDMVFNHATYEAR